MSKVPKSTEVTASLCASKRLMGPPLDERADLRRSQMTTVASSLPAPSRKGSVGCEARQSTSEKSFIFSVSRIVPVEISNTTILAVPPTASVVGESQQHEKMAESMEEEEEEVGEGEGLIKEEVVVRYDCCDEACDVELDGMKDCQTHFISFAKSHSFNSPFCAHVASSLDITCGFGSSFCPLFLSFRGNEVAAVNEKGETATAVTGAMCALKTKGFQHGQRGKEESHWVPEEDGFREGCKKGSLSREEVREVGANRGDERVSAAFTASSYSGTVTGMLLPFFWRIEERGGECKEGLPTTFFSAEEEEDEEEDAKAETAESAIRTRFVGLEVFTVFCTGEAQGDALYEEDTLNPFFSIASSIAGGNPIRSIAISASLLGGLTVSSSFARFVSFEDE